MKGADRILALCLLTLLLAASWQSAQLGVSRYYVREAELADPNEVLLRRALAFDSGNPDIHRLRGLAFYADSAFTEASSEFDRAISLRPADYQLRVYRGRTRNALGDFHGAETDYRTATLLAPHYAEPQIELGRFLLRANRVTEAFPYLGRAATIDESLLPDVLDLARNTYPADAVAIFRAVNPQNESARTRTVLYLIKNNMASEALASFVAQSLDEEGALEAARELIKLKKFRIAYEIWKPKHQPEKLSGDASNLVIDGDFESFCCERTGGFGWQVEHDESKTEIAVSHTGGFSDSRGLEINFNGDPNPGRLLIGQLIPVNPKSSYRLTFLSNSERLVSGGLPTVCVLDGTSTRVVAESSPLGSPEREWRRTVMDFNIPENTDGIIIGLRRSGCPSSPCPIFGQIRLDDFVLTLRGAR